MMFSMSYSILRGLGTSVQYSNASAFRRPTRTHQATRKGRPSFSCFAAQITMKATVNGVVIAESSACEVVEGNQYFPPDSVKKEYLKPSDYHTVCGWKGTASYYTVDVNGSEIKDAAWYYPTPKAAASQIKDYVAFWKGVKVGA